MTRSARSAALCRAPRCAALSGALTTALFLLGCVALLGGCLIERIDRREASRDVEPGGPVDHDLIQRLRDHVAALARPRSFAAPKQLAAAAAYITGKLDELTTGGAVRREQSYQIADQWMRALRARAWQAGCTDTWHRQLDALRAAPPDTFKNIELLLPGQSPAAGTVVVGAHYDSAGCESGGVTPGADDNASGVAVLIELARALASRQRTGSVRLVAFTNEEEPFFHTAAMGSTQYLATLPIDATPRAMLSLETLGYYRDDRDSQSYPPLVDRLLGLPDVGDFIAFIGNPASKALLGRALCGFGRRPGLPAEGWAVAGWVPGADWSDHWSFWSQQIPALMVTDTAPNRNRCYHQRCDVPERLDYARMAQVVGGLTEVVEALAGEPPRDATQCPAGAT